jgi:hypothetical protein
VAKQDPTEKPLGVRCHMVDCLLYLEAEELIWFDQTKAPWQLGYKPYDGIGWYR